MTRIKHQTQQTLSKEKSQIQKMKVVYDLLSLCVNEGIDLIAKCFTKINLTKIKFFYITHYSLEKFDQLYPDHPQREIIVTELNDLISVLNDKEIKCGVKQNRTANVLVTICQLLGIHLSLDDSYNPSQKNIFPKVQTIHFANTWYDCSEFYKALQIDEKIISMAQSHILQKNVHLIKMSSNYCKVDSLYQLSECLSFDVIVKESLYQNSTIDQSNDNCNDFLYDYNNTYNNYYDTFQWYINDELYTIQLIDNTYCYVWDQFGNSTYLQYGLTENGSFYIL